MPISIYRPPFIHQFFSIITLIGVVSCQRHIAPPPAVATLHQSGNVPDRDFEAEGFTKGIMFDNSKLDGCSFMIKTEDGTLLQPAKLDSAFAVDGLAVWLRYGMAKNYMGSCMSGNAIVIQEIVKR